MLASGGAAEVCVEGLRLASHGSSQFSGSPWSVWIPLAPVAQIVSGVSAISSSLCRIISRSTVYLETKAA